MDKLLDLLPTRPSGIIELANTPLNIPTWIVLVGIIIWWVERKHYAKK